MKDFYRQKGVARESYTSNKWIGCDMVTFLQGMAGVYQADDLTRADQVIPDDWFKIPFLGEAKTLIKY